MATTTEDRLDATFAALANTTRRAMLARLAQGEATVNELAEPFDLSLPAISKHLKVLERAGPGRSRPAGAVPAAHPRPRPPRGGLVVGRAVPPGLGGPPGPDGHLPAAAPTQTTRTRDHHGDYEDARPGEDRTDVPRAPGGDLDTVDATGALRLLVRPRGQHGPGRADGRARRRNPPAVHGGTTPQGPRRMWFTGTYLEVVREPAPGVHRRHGRRARQRDRPRADGHAGRPPYRSPRSGWSSSPSMAGPGWSSPTSASPRAHPEPSAGRWRWTSSASS